MAFRWPSGKQMTFKFQKLERQTLKSALGPGKPLTHWDRHLFLKWLWDLDRCTHIPLPASDLWLWCAGPVTQRSWLDKGRLSQDRLCKVVQGKNSVFLPM